MDTEADRREPDQMRRDEPHNLHEVLDAACQADGSSEAVQVGDILDTVGQRSFGPLLVVLALIAFTPLGGIPGLPSVLAVIVIATAGQMLFGVGHFWLPEFLLKRSIARDRLDKTIGYVRPVARGIDKLLRPRLSWLLEEPYIRLAAIGCILAALTVPPLEVVPFAGSVSWAAIGTFGLATIARDGFLLLVALAFAVGAFGVLGWTFL